jgi:hypothetical protein
LFLLFFSLLTKIKHVIKVSIFHSFLYVFFLHYLFFLSLFCFNFVFLIVLLNFSYLKKNC